MGWEHTAREERLAPVGEYRPEHYRVTVHDTFQQRRLTAAAHSVRNGMSLPEFFLWCADYVLDRHRQLATVRKAYRKAARRIIADGRTPDATARHLDEALSVVFEAIRARGEATP
jgi:hypothetical protein